MVSFFCFGTSLHYNKSKKIAHREIQSTENPVITVSADCSWNFNDADKQSINSPKIKKSLSLGSVLDPEGQASLVNDSDTESRCTPNQRCFDRQCSLKSSIMENGDDIHEDISSGKDFNTKRIEEWVTNQLDCCVLEDELCNVAEHQAKKVAVAGRSDGKIDPGMEVAKRYISSLSLTASSAQLANHGLLVIPFLSVFGCLKAINLSGNAIARITPGSLPRGLHRLNLSKNHISAIEGLRELTRLRVLDLSCNRIFRIGHGLASCTSLKELYLAGNKISDVEGLHRLLKLTVMDLGFNKISTSKSLGELAANYNSLQAINLEGNPAQKNVGDAQLKKFAQGLLPRLAYYNKQSIKTGSLKDIVDRSSRLGIAAAAAAAAAADRKNVRKGTTTAGHRSHAVAGAGAGAGAGRHHPTTVNKTSFDLGGSSRAKQSMMMRRSQSEGILSQL